MVRTDAGSVDYDFAGWSGKCCLKSGRAKFNSNAAIGRDCYKGQREVYVERVPDISGTRIWSGQKNEVLNVTNLDANIAEKTARQVFATVPGVFVYDMDGAGNQINIATRGLDPRR